MKKSNKKKEGKESIIRGLWYVNPNKKKEEKIS
jgi:hypothetical protein